MLLLATDIKRHYSAAAMQIKQHSSMSSIPGGQQSSLFMRLVTNFLSNLVGPRDMTGPDTDRVRVKPSETAMVGKD